MFKFTLTLIAAFFLSSCSYMHVHKQDITQGNIITPGMISQVHRGMSTQQVKDIMGPPMTTNLFSPNRLVYVYTMQPGGERMSEQQVTFIFKNGYLIETQQS